MATSRHATYKRLVKNLVTKSSNTSQENKFEEIDSYIELTELRETLKLVKRLR